MKMREVSAICTVRIPVGWRLLSIGSPRKGDRYINPVDGDVLLAVSDHKPYRLFPIIERAWPRPAWAQPGFWLCKYGNGWVMSEHEPHWGLYGWNWRRDFFPVGNVAFPWTEADPEPELCGNLPQDMKFQVPDRCQDERSQPRPYGPGASAFEEHKRSLSTTKVETNKAYETAKAEQIGERVRVVFSDGSSLDVSLSDYTACCKAQPIAGPLNISRKAWDAWFCEFHKQEKPKQAIAESSEAQTQKSKEMWREFLTGQKTIPVVYDSITAQSETGGTVTIDLSQLQGRAVVVSIEGDTVKVDIEREQPKSE